jgi:hypothetical protein
MVGTFDQKAPQVDVAGLSDAELRIAITRLTASGSETEIATNITTLLETLLASQGLLSNPNRHRARTTTSSSRVRIQNRWRATCSRNQASNKSKDPDKGKTTTMTLTPVTCSYKWDELFMTFGHNDG